MNNTDLITVKPQQEGVLVEKTGNSSTIVNNTTNKGTLVNSKPKGSVLSVNKSENSISAAEVTKGSISVSSGTRGSLSVATAATNNYERLINKPSINGITLSGDLTTAELGIIDDLSVTDIKTWSSTKIKQALDSVVAVKEIVGTVLKPIVASELPFGTYILSGLVQSSYGNPTFFDVPRKQYVVNRSVEETTVLWEENPYASTRYYITFFHTNRLEPQENTVELITRQELEQAAFDCGTF